MPRPPRTAEVLRDGDEVLRRAPFSDNPRVGARGERAQQRILAAALKVFGELGYHQTGINAITEEAGCSRAAFYQYFSSKEDVFRHLAGQVGRQVLAAADALDQIGADEDGWRTLHEWVTRRAELYQRYRPVFLAYQAAAESDDAVASGSARIAQRSITGIRSRLVDSTLPPRHVDGVIALLQELLTRLPRIVGVLPDAVPRDGTTSLTDRQVLAVTDIVHRTFFGLAEDVNVNVDPSRRRARSRRAPAFEVPAARAPLPDADLGPTGRRTMKALLDAAHDVLVARGYHATRVDDIAGAAGLSHGAFYRYFENKDHVVQILASRATEKLAAVFADLPRPGDGALLRTWLRRYVKTYRAATAMVRVWVDASEEAGNPDASAAALEAGRRRLVSFLAPRRFDGDTDTDALLVIALVDALSAVPAAADRIEAAALVIERGLLGES